MKKLSLVLSLVLAGCVTPGEHFKQASTHCNLLNQATQYGSCLETELDKRVPNWHSDQHAMYVSSYIAWLKAAGSRVEKGEMKEQDFWSGKDELLERLVTQAKAEAQANQANQANQGNALATFLTGLAIMSYGAQPAYPVAAPLPNTVTPITCRTLGYGVVRCY